MYEESQESQISWQEIPNPMVEKVKKKSWLRTPTKLTPELIENAKKYLTQYTGDMLCDFNGKTIRQARLPSKKGLALWVGITEKSGINYCTIKDDDEEEIKQLKEEYIDICETIDLLAEEMLRQGALDGTYTAQSANFQLAANYGYVTKTEIKQNTNLKMGAEELIDKIKNS